MNLRVFQPTRKFSFAYISTFELRLSSQYNNTHLHAFCSFFVLPQYDGLELKILIKFSVLQVTPYAKCPREAT